MGFDHLKGLADNPMAESVEALDRLFTEKFGELDKVQQAAIIGMYASSKLLALAAEEVKAKDRLNLPPEIRFALAVKLVKVTQATSLDQCIKMVVDGLTG